MHVVDMPERILGMNVNSLNAVSWLAGGCGQQTMRLTRGNEVS